MNTKVLNIYKVLEGPVAVEDSPIYPDGFLVTYLAESEGDFGELEYWFDSLEAFQKTQDYLTEYVKPFKIMPSANKRAI